MGRRTQKCVEHAFLSARLAGLYLVHTKTGDPPLRSGICFICDGTLKQVTDFHLSISTFSVGLLAAVPHFPLRGFRCTEPIGERPLSMEESSVVGKSAAFAAFCL